jgi:hypothetical protein
MTREQLLTRQFPAGRTPHAHARKVAERGWSPHDSKASWQDSIKFKGKMELPKAKRP